MTGFLFIRRFFILRTLALCALASFILTNCSKDENNQKNPITLTCASNVTEAACQTTAAINAEFTSWLATTTFTGGCNAVISNNNTGAPDECGGVVAVTFTLTSTCDSTVTCTATFYVTAAPSLVLVCPGNKTESIGQTQAEINAKFASWLASVTFFGGCNAVISNNNTSAPPNTGGFTLVSFTAASTCEPTKTCSAVFSVY